MTTAQRNKIILEDFDSLGQGFFKHKNNDVFAVVPKRDGKLLRKIIFVHCKDEKPINNSLKYGVKFYYNTEEELMTFIAAIAENQ